MTVGLYSGRGVARNSRHGRFVIDEPTDLPEGTVLNLAIDDEGDELDDREHRAISAAIERSLVEGASGESAPVEVILARLRARRT